MVRKSAPARPLLNTSLSIAHLQKVISGLVHMNFSLSPPTRGGARKLSYWCHAPWVCYADGVTTWGGWGHVLFNYFHRSSMQRLLAYHHQPRVELEKWITGVMHLEYPMLMVSLSEREHVLLNYFHRSSVSMDTVLWTYLCPYQLELQTSLGIGYGVLQNKN
jgi:hypothetical protein